MKIPQELKSYIAKMRKYYGKKNGVVPFLWDCNGYMSAFTHKCKKQKKFTELP